MVNRYAPILTAEQRKKVSAAATDAIDSCLQKAEAGTLSSTDVNEAKEKVLQAGGPGQFKNRYGGENPLTALSAFMSSSGSNTRLGNVLKAQKTSRRKAVFNGKSDAIIAGQISPDRAARCATGGPSVLAQTCG